MDLESIYLVPRICTLRTKLMNFQFKFLHWRIATNSSLFKIKLPEPNLRWFVNQHKKCCFIFSRNACSQKPFGIVFYNFSSLLIWYHPHAQVLTLCQCLGLKEGKSALLFYHCLLLDKFYIYSYNYKNIFDHP